MSEKQSYSREGLEKLKDELEYLKNTRRAEVAHDLEVARGFGDLSENAEYDEARNQQAQVETRILELEDLIRNAVVADESAVDVSVVSVGSTVRVFDVDENAEDTYCVVGANEVDPAVNHVSDMSPIGRALVGKRAGEDAVVCAPCGEYTLKVLAVERTKKA